MFSTTNEVHHHLYTKTENAQSSRMPDLYEKNKQITRQRTKNYTYIFRAQTICNYTHTHTHQLGKGTTQQCAQWHRAFATIPSGFTISLYISLSPSSIVLLCLSILCFYFFCTCICVLLINTASDTHEILLYLYNLYSR